MAVAPGATLEASAASRRFAIGANVAISVLAALGIVVAVNWIAATKSVRRDLASAGNYGLSDRTKRIISNCDGDVQVSMLYLPDPEDDQQSERIARMQDYLDELTRFSKRVTAAHVATDSQRERLVARLSGKFGSEADKHQEALNAFEKLATSLDGDIQQRLQSAQRLLAGGTWLGDFPMLANIAAKLRADSESLRKAEEQIKELTAPGGIPKYGDAVTKAKDALSQVKTHLEAIDKQLAELARLARETTRPDSTYVRSLRETAKEVKSLVDSLRAILGADSDPIPPDPAAPLKAFADRSVQVGSALDRLVSRVDRFAQDFPMVTQHPNWAASVQIGPLVTRMEVGDVLHQAGQTLGSARLSILGVIDEGDPAQLRRAFEEVRNHCTVLEQNGQACEGLLIGLADGLSNLDDASRAILDAAEAGGLFKDRIAEIDAQQKAFDELPELKLGSAADELRKENVVVVEYGDKIRVVDYGEVWPVREPIPGMSDRDESTPRTFNGDSAIGSAILALTQNGPFATVVLTGFEPPAPPQQNQFMPRPPQSWLPLNQLSTLRARLEAANFKVVDWNLATTPEPPEPEAGTEPIYVLLPPPPPAPPNPFGGSQPPDQVFGEKQRQKIAGLLDGGARMLFLASWEIRSSGGIFGGPPMTPPYGYGPLLEKDWGIRVENNRRVTWIEPDRKRDDSFYVVGPKFMQMPVGGWTEHPIGEPLRGTRILIENSCVLQETADPPEGVTHESVLRIPDHQNYVGAVMSELVQIINTLNDPRSEGLITMRPMPRSGPFDVMLTAHRVAAASPADNSPSDEKGDDAATQGAEPSSKEPVDKGRIVVCGFGGSFRDDFLQQPVMSAGERIKLEPPPTEVVDVFVNALYWLSNKEELIARGPVPVPQIGQIAAGELTLLRSVVWGIWPAAVFLPGLVAWYLRRQ